MRLTIPPTLVVEDRRVRPSVASPPGMDVERLEERVAHRLLPALPILLIQTNGLAFEVEVFHLQIEGALPPCPSLEMETHQEAVKLRVVGAHVDAFPQLGKLIPGERPTAALVAFPLHHLLGRVAGDVAILDGQLEEPARRCHEVLLRTPPIGGVGASAGGLGGRQRRLLELGHLDGVEGPLTVASGQLCPVGAVGVGGGSCGSLDLREVVGDGGTSGVPLLERF